jgi:hypothetical protein
MYRAGIETKQAYLLLAPFQGAVNDARTMERPLLGDAISSKHPFRAIGRSAFGKLLEGNERASLDAATKVLSRYTGMDILGCGAESLVTRRGYRVVKFAPYPAYDPRLVALELSRRFEVAQAILGKYILPTEFVAGSRDGVTPSSIVMFQDYVNIVGDAQLTPPAGDQLGEFKELAQKLARRKEGILIDVCPGRGNLAVTGDGGSEAIVAIDASLVAKSDHGKPMLIASRFIVDAHKVEADIDNL